MSKTRYYKIEVYFQVEDDGWDSGCDETFHGPGRLHQPEQGVYVAAYDEVSKGVFNKNKYRIFDKYGGI